MTPGGGPPPAGPPLLFDQNLAAALARRLADRYPGSAHVRDAGLAAADDEAVWAHAGAGGYAIVTKDDDFRQRSFLLGPPPKVIWVKLGNCSTVEVEAALRARDGDVVAFAADPGVNDRVILPTSGRLKLPTLGVPAC